MFKHYLIVTGLSAFFASCVCAAENAPTLPDSLHGVLDRIHQHASAVSWQEAGWKDEQIEGWLDDVTGKIAKAANFHALKLPMRFADVKAGDASKPQSLNKSLLVGKNFDWHTASLSHCIVLADGNVSARRLENCVVVARGVVSVDSSHSSVLVAGAYVKSLADGEQRKNENGSLLVTPGWVHVEAINGSVIAAGEEIATGLRVEGGIFVNATLVLGEMSALTQQRRPRSVKVRDLPIGEFVNHSLNEQLEICGVIYREVIDNSDRHSPARLMALINRDNQSRPQATGVLVRYAGTRYVANLGQAVVSQNGQPVESLAGWVLSYANDKLAVFSNDKADAVIQVEEP